MRLLPLLAALLTAPLAAEPIVSPAPEAVSVTVYPDPARSPDDMSPDRPDYEWLRGYALIGETRTLTLPAGTSEIRFEGVAGGMLPRSAILKGLPDGVLEQNRDARLLSPAALLDGSLGKRVTIRRTDPATGRLREEAAVIRSGADQGVVLETREGIEALGCSGLPETPVYDGVPEGLSARPTFSVRVRLREAVTAAVTLSYLATGFDWRADYVAEVASGGRSLDLFAWVTLVNGDETSFRDATTQTVAGRLNREAAAAEPDPAEPYLALRCWPTGAVYANGDGFPPPPPPPPPPLAAPMAMRSFAENAAQDIVVTAMKVREEALGDLKLFRVPEPVTVAARSSKQVALLDRKAVPVETVYRLRIGAADETAGAAQLVLRMQNRADRGLGLALPAGRVAVFERRDDRPLLIGQATMRDRAVGEEAEIELGERPQVRFVAEAERIGRREERRTLTLSNANPWPVRTETELLLNEGDRLQGQSVRLGRKNGRPLWSATVPANGRATLSYRVRASGAGEDDDARRAPRR